MEKEKNPMRKIRIEKVTLNIGAGKDQKMLEKGQTLLKNITGIAPVTTKTEKRIASWGLRPGLPVGCKLTLRGEDANKLLVRMLEAKDNVLKKNNFDDAGNIAFGVHEYIDIPGVEYDPKIGVIGLQICISLERPGFRIKKKRIRSTKLGKNHKIPQADSIQFMKSTFNISMEEQDDVQ